MDKVMPSPFTLHALTCPTCAGARDDRALCALGAWLYNGRPIRRGRPC